MYTPENPRSMFANLLDAMDMFIVAHWFGWWFKMLALRDAMLCCFLATTFEGLELTFKHWLPNFAECWWDSLILDILLCNSIGIYLGHLTCKYLEMKSFTWFGHEDKKKKGTCSQVSKFFALFSPNVWKNYNWHVFDSTSNFLAVSWLIALSSVADLNNFTLKFLIWIPANHWTLLFRVILLAFLSMNSIGEYYEYIGSK